ncbi:PIN domain-containing protein [Tsuneonella amylolytica]|uniref:PIN domain-containing protein n=1 Tax=Tsuneonella amylolytica TaxID=2338327 RepID=UPI002D77108E|nr:PIN domain-containing protein [Tsuneonella amylolytica]
MKIAKGDLLGHFGLDELDEEIALRAAAIRRQKPRSRWPDAFILATAQTRGRVLVTRNTKDSRP